MMSKEVDFSEPLVMPAAVKESPSTFRAPKTRQSRRVRLWPVVQRAADGSGVFAGGGRGPGGTMEFSR
jgi:hypothetical protein